MANITEVSQWENVIRQLENGEAATGGADGLANVQAKQLANRTQYLKNNYLPLSGGAMSGNIRNTNNNTGLALLGATNTEDGAYLNLSGVDNADYPGWFGLGAGKYAVDNSHAQLIGKPDGSLLWNKNDLAGSAIVAKSLSHNGYVRYASGLVIQWFSSTEITIAANTSGSYIKTTSPIAVTTPLFCMGSIGTVNNTAKLFLRNIAYEDGHTVHHQCMNIDNVEAKYFVRYLFIGIA